ncbi:putative transcriptional regulator [Pedobacter sp. UYEF25]
MEDLSVFKSNLGKQIAHFRLKKGFTQAQLGALLNKDFQSISRIENGKINISAWTLKQITIALEISSQDLLDI